MKKIKALSLILIVALYFSVKWARSNLNEKRIPLLAVLAAGIFAIMSMNMPIAAGTSGHMVGGALVAIVFLAPEAAVLVFTVVLLVQALIFGDGGITALGANVLNMAIIGGFVAAGKEMLSLRFCEETAAIGFARRPRP